ncbi:hypothetical protein [Tropicibacter sp. S64]|uniref:hypothetical protein n=1 Tax=Tropicibacter sp. S64 TaxID=3415122 RepID=UPI003C7DD59D
MRSTAVLRPADPSCGAWRHPARPRPGRALFNEAVQLLAMAAAAALATGVITTLILMSGPVRAQDARLPDTDQSPISEPSDPTWPPRCACVLPADID